MRVDSKSFFKLVIDWFDETKARLESRQGKRNTVTNILPQTVASETHSLNVSAISGLGFGKNMKYPRIEENNLTSRSN
jgi:hypothetical protein